MDKRRRHRGDGGPLACLVYVALAMITACSGGGNGPVTIDWDLSASHTVEDIGKDPGPGTNHYGIEEVMSIRVALPGDRSFEADDVQDIRVSAKGNEVDGIDVVLVPRTAEEAHARARTLAQEWDLRHQGLDDWLEKIRAARTADGDEAAVGQALAVDTGTDPVAFAPSVEIRYSFDDAKPWVVSFNMYWDPDFQ